MAQYEIGRTGEEWYWTLRSDGGRKKDGAEGFATRGEALHAARLSRGDTPVNITLEDGTPMGMEYWRGGPERIVLMNGKEIAGEVDGPLGGGGDAQEVGVEPAGETGAAA